jgi:hypothetical protein
LSRKISRTTSVSVPDLDGFFIMTTYCQFDSMLSR